jgi:hypothetical protein
MGKSDGGSKLDVHARSWATTSAKTASVAGHVRFGCPTGRNSTAPSAHKAGGRQARLSPGNVMRGAHTQIGRLSLQMISWLLSAVNTSEAASLPSRSESQVPTATLPLISIANHSPRHLEAATSSCTQNEARVCCAAASERPAHAYTITLHPHLQLLHMYLLCMYAARAFVRVTTHPPSLPWPGWPSPHGLMSCLSREKLYVIHLRSVTWSPGCGSLPRSGCVTHSLLHMTQWDELHTQLHVPADGRKVWVSGEDLLYKPLAHSLRLETSPHPQQLGIPAARHCALALAGHPTKVLPRAGTTCISSQLLTTDCV